MDISVSDPFGAAGDPEMPSLALALDPLEARKELKRRLPRLSGPNGKLRLHAIRVTRHKPGRRCVVEYDVLVANPNTAAERVTIIAKVRARRYGNESLRLLEQFWNSGFDSASPDGISVPEPLGVIARFQMWFQRKAPGETATRLLAASEGIQLAARVAKAIHKVHLAKVPTERRHGMADELRILHECLAKVEQWRPAWAERLRRVAVACDRLAGTVPEPVACGIHRDFYPAQVLVAPERLYLLDFDLYCLGDSALDAGNYIAHMTEQALRELGNAGALEAQEQALARSFISLAGPQVLPAVRAYTILSLVRHIYLSTQFPERQQFTEPILKLCEERLAKTG